MPLRVLTCIHSFDPGGVERIALRLCSEWAQQGTEVVVAVGRDSGAMRADAPVLDYRIAPQTRLPVASLETIWMIWWLWLTLRRVRPDVLFIPGNTYAIVGVAMRLLLGRSCPSTVLKVSNDLVRAQPTHLRRLSYSWWCRLQGRLIDRFVALAEPMRKQVSRMMAVEGRRVALIPNPVMTSVEQSDYVAAGERSRASKGAGRRYLAAGRLVAQKNFALLIDAFAMIAWQQDRLVIVGEGPERPALEAGIARRGLGQKVRLVGYQQSIAPWLADADVFVLSSDFEGLPAVIVEALAAGLPVVATDCCASMRALLDDGLLGRLVPAGDHIALSVAMALAEPGSTSRARAWRKAARFGAERAAVSYIATFSDLAPRTC